MNIFDKLLKGIRSIINFFINKRQIMLLILQILSPFLIVIGIIVVMYLIYKAAVVSNKYYRKYKISDKLSKFYKKHPKFIKIIWFVINTVTDNAVLTIFLILLLIYVSGNPDIYGLEAVKDGLMILLISVIVAIPYRMYKRKKSAPENTGTDKS